MNNQSQSPHTTPSCSEAVDEDGTQDVLTPSIPSRLVEVLDRYLEDMKRGNLPSREALLAEHPELAEQLDACLAGIDFIQASANPGPEASQQLGDFRIVREVGRGGMGAVYEAEQLSLGRRVALKVLRYGAVTAADAASRFQREAETVANLHHTNIVPLYSVGSENGVHFYAMQFIEGRSLDIVRAQSKADLAVKTVARWGLQAAEALAHAHERNVIHRDVKPSNLMLDHEGRIWLTDFGLSKRLDDLTLSRTGALLGTPRYMSPEQAAANHSDVDCRSDIYSLGATLYELVTNRPVVDAETHLAMIQKILEGEVTPPGQFRPAIPRDFETILLKCLSKHADQRYASAEELADDLRAFLEDRPIKARRASFAELAARWLRHHRKQVVRTAVTMGATAAILLLSVLAWQSWSRSRLAWIELNSEDPVVARFTDRRGIEQTVTLPTQDPVEVAAGDIQIELTGKEMSGQMHLASLKPGQRVRYETQNDTEGEAGRIVIRRAYRILPNDHGADVILMDDEGIQRHDAEGHVSRWSLKFKGLALAPSDRPVELAWPWLEDEPFVVGQGRSSHIAGRSHDHPELDVDLNGDGEGDVIVAARHEAWVLAVSGREGQPLWVRRFAEARDPEAATIRSSITNPPLMLGDINGDDVQDLLVTCSAMTSGGEFKGEPPRRWLEAISGADGATLWECELRSEWFDLPRGVAIPACFQWFPHGTSATTVSGSNNASRHDGIVFRSRSKAYQRHGFHLQVPDSPQLLSMASLHGEGAGRAAALAFVAGRFMVLIDAGSGALVRATDVGVNSVQPARWADVDGDGILDAVILHKKSEQLRCSVWSIAQRSMLWDARVNATDPTVEPGAQSAAWPLVTDLDEDGVAEVILPGDSSANQSRPRLPWGELLVLNGTDGQRRWAHRVIDMDQQIDHFAVGPDLDGDGTRDIFIATLWGDTCDLYVEALSGAAGRTLWWNRQDLPQTSTRAIDYVVGQLCWGSPGADGWAQLLVHTRPENVIGASQVYAFSSATGQLIQALQDVDAATPADVDGDGINDLFCFRKSENVAAASAAGELDVVRHGIEHWRRLAGPRWTQLPDLDGDGFRDVMAEAVAGVVQTFSGRDGSLLWETQGENFTTLSFMESAATEVLTGQMGASQDLDGDRHPDLLAWQRHGASSSSCTPFQAFSGRTGKRLWTADIRIHVLGGVPLMEIRDLDGDAVPEVVLVAVMDWGYDRRASYGGNDQQLWLAVLDGENGNVRWKQPLSKAYGGLTATQKPPYDLSKVAVSVAYLDCNGDGLLDLVLPAESAADRPSWEWRAFDGRQGAVLWRHTLPLSHDARPWEKMSRATLVDLDDDGHQELLLMALGQSTGSRGETKRVHELVALSADGSERWRWQMDTPPLFDWYHNEPLDRRGPIVLRRADGTRRICLPFTSASSDGTSELTILDRLGNPVAQRKFDSDVGYRVWAIDDGATAEHLVLANFRGLLGLNVDQLETPVWQRQLDGTDPMSGATVIGMWKDADRPLLLLRQPTGDNSLQGIDALDGSVTWRCLGPRPRNRFGWIAMASVNLLNQQPELPPLVFFQAGHVALCRQAQRTRSPVSTKDAAMLGSRAAEFHVVPTFQPATGDPRLLRQLPWNRGVGELVRFAREYWLWASVYSLTMIVLPAGMLWWLVVRRRWGMRTVMTLPVVVAVFLLGVSLSGPDPVEFMWWQKILVGVAFVPVLVLLASFASWMIMCQWSNAGRWLIVAATISLTLALLLLAFARRGDEPWFPGERYALAGWHWIWLAGFYVTGWAMLSSIPTTWRSIQTRCSATTVPWSEH